jgi:hypothetical protein
VSLLYFSLTVLGNLTHIAEIEMNSGPGDGGTVSGYHLLHSKLLQCSANLLSITVVSRAIFEACIFRTRNRSAYYLHGRNFNDIGLAYHHCPESLIRIL